MSYDDSINTTHAVVIDLLGPVYAVTSPAMVRPAIENLGTSMTQRLEGRDDIAGIAGMVYANLVSWAFGSAQSRCGCGKPNCGGATTAFRVLDVDTLTHAGRVVDVDDAPPVARAVGRFITASCNGDTDTVHAVWHTLLVQADRDDINTFVRSVVHAAVTVAEQRLSIPTTSAGGARS